MSVQYTLPTMQDEYALKEYMQEHYANGEKSISASLGLPEMQYADWVERIQSNVTEGDGDWGRSLLYICRKDDRIIGLLSIRYELAKELSEKYGDIGYGVRPSERGKGYATKMLRYALTICREHGMRSVIMGCYKDNLPSAAVIRKCNGILFEERISTETNRISQYYRIIL